jgi:hypothetical protein
MRTRSVATVLRIAGLAVPSAAGATTAEHHPRGRYKPAHTNCGEHKPKEARPPATPIAAVVESPQHSG